MLCIRGDHSTPNCNYICLIYHKSYRQINQETLLIYRRYQYCLRQQKLQISETFHDYEPASHLDSIDKMR